MRHLQLGLAGSETILHPLARTLTDDSMFTDARMMQWSATRDPDRATVLLYLHGDLDAFERKLKQTELVLDYSFSKLDSGRGYVLLHSEPHPTEWRLFDIVNHEPIIPVFPFPYHADGSITIHVIGPLERLQAVVESAPPGSKRRSNASARTIWVKTQFRPPLADRQLEALAIALEIGYFEIPRNATRKDVADHLGCAPSTASEHLRKAERNVLETYINQLA
jgi:predicted DNA binding protein